jgi:integrase
MAMLRLRYVHSFVDKTGRVRYYFRYRGRRWPLPGEPGSAEFAARYDELCRQYTAPRRAGNVTFGPNTLGSVIERYLGSEEFTSKAHGTRRKYRQILDRLREIGGRGLIADLREEHVREIRKRFPASSAADIAVILLSGLWTFAKEDLAMRLGANPAADIRRLHRRAWEHEPWPEDVIGKFEAEARPKPNAALALLLLLYTGQRVGDVATMRWTQYDGRGIEVRQQKTGRLLWVPCHLRLRDALDHAEHRSEFILTTQRGAGYGSGSLGNMIMQATAELGFKQYTAHGLRKNAAIAMIEAGSEVPQVMAVLGHKTWEMAMHYAQERDQRKLAQQAIDKWEVANQERKGSKGSG